MLSLSKQAMNEINAEFNRVMELPVNPGSNPGDPNFLLLGKFKNQRNLFV